MFEREAALHAAVRHDNVVEVYGSGVHGDEPWLAMEWVDGCDLFRLLRRLSNAGRHARDAASRCYVARELLRALESVHARARRGRAADGDHPPGRDAVEHLPVGRRTGEARRLRHRALGEPLDADATPAGRCSRESSRTSRRSRSRASPSTSAPTSSRRRWSSPRCSSGARSSPGAGSSRCCSRSATAASTRSATRGPRCPPGSSRCSSARSRAIRRTASRRRRAFSEALAPFDSNPAAARAELGALVRWVQSAPSAEQMQAVRDSGAKLRAAASARAMPPTTPRVAADPRRRSRPAARRRRRGRRFRATTGEYAPIPSFVTTAAGDRLGPWPFARLVEAIATGDVGRGDLVEFMGREPAPLGSIDELARFLPALTAATTNRMAGVGVPGLRRQRVAGGARDGAGERHRVRGDRRPLRRGPDRVAARARARHRVLGSQGALLRVGQARAHRVEQRERAAGRVPGSTRASSRAWSSTSRSPCSRATAGAWATRSPRWASCRRSTSSARSAIRAATG